VWQRQLGTASTENAFAVAIDQNDEVYVAGCTTGLLGDNADDAHPGNYDAFLAKLDKQGERLWVRQFGAEEAEFARSVAVDREGNLILAGETAEGVGASYHGYYDAFARKYDGLGRVLWTRQFGASDTDDDARGVATARSGHAFATGYTGGALWGPNAGGYDMFVMQLLDP
jgi:hypothetical protein